MNEIKIIILIGFLSYILCQDYPDMKSGNWKFPSDFMWGAATSAYQVN